MVLAVPDSIATAVIIDMMVIRVVRDILAMMIIIAIRVVLLLWLFWL